MAVIWNTPAGSLGIITERVVQDIAIEASSNTGPVTFSLLAGSLPRGLRLASDTELDSTISVCRIKGSPTEVRRYTESRFVVRASDGVDIEDRTFSIAVDGSDEPQWLTQEGFLNVGEGENYFVLDNSYVDFQLEAYDPDVIAGDTIEFYLRSGELPPGLTLTPEGRLFGFTDPVFSVEIQTTGGYDSGPFDRSYLDKATKRTNGFDTYFFDLVTYDYFEDAEAPRRLSRFYSFVIGATDGANEVRRLFNIWVVTEEFLQADNSLVQVDSNLFRADNTGQRVPIWITNSNLGRYRANNYLTVYLDVYDPPTLSGTIAYILLDVNPDGSPSELPPGMSLDSITGEIAGRVPYQARVSKTYTFTMQAIDFPVTLADISYELVGDWNFYTVYTENQAVRYDGFIYVALQTNTGRLPDETDSQFWNKGVNTAEKTFTIEIIGEIESGIEWISGDDLGTIKPNQPSLKEVEARSLLYGGRVVYELISGSLPPGLEFLSTGIIKGKVKQFADSDGPGLTRFYERLDNEGLNSSLEDSSSMYRDFTTTFDGDTTGFDKKFTFTIRARDALNYVEFDKEFFLTVIADNTKTFANLFIKAFQTKEKRLAYYDFITNNDIFRTDELYRPGDENFGIQTEAKILMYAGIESAAAVNYVQAMSRNHYRKQIRFGEVKYAAAKDPDTQVTLYEVIYVDIVDEYQKNGKSISQTIELPDNINSKVLISYDAIKVSSDIPLISDSDHQRIFPNSIKNMRKRIKSIGERDRTFLPLWMRSIQEDSFVESGYLAAMVICYCKPKNAEKIISRIKASEFDFKTINFTADRYLIDVLEGELAAKYLAFPQIGEKLP